ncbi:hypothetical protein EPUS_03441 [Endocarpon pusillum Z07020]|uniref:Aminoacyl-transfer RNA synthetases class-II family profile domain-containing protein n=1 Tax=Endocarpon pusillum (strain Z07020 / HMAS-L-300199) TaxID=1263415 RepID=U1G1Z8_ENDPU|nr:uncharacterized protein EPUS_03441 [Endocarpon pusillum Z07020]ERF71287.1 hypothetical protein EPUS_03441 [Endocarpon pusillum Z07020]
MRPVETEGQDQASLGLEGPNIVYYTKRKEEGDATKDKPLSSIEEIKYDPYIGEVATISQIEMVVSSIQALNYFPADIIAKTDTNFPPEQRHLQLRTSSNLRKTLQARSKAQTECRKYLFVKGFDEIETPILFKSTPEGAREFLVPTRQRGLAYALPQSPQQYKQILMASGISKYFQFARCFRDEDMRADRQPEFTQLDIEMSFASTDDVMKITERIIQVLWQTFFSQTIFENKIKTPKEYNMRDIPYHAPLYFPQITYDRAMTLWGSDKPDTRIGFHLLQVEDFLDSTLKSKLSPLKDPVIDLLKVRVSNPEKTRHFISTFLDKPSNAAYLDNPHGVPGIFIFDPSKPMNGLSAFEHDAAETIVDLLHPQRGDLLVLQARPDQPFMGEGFTMIGNLRRDLHAALISEGIIRKPFRDEFLWVTDFPLFSPTNDSDPGQGGKAGIKSTHHPFTAPKTMWDVDRLNTDPLSCKADHFDLVINGVEIGGGSRRIHDSKVQEMVLRDILKVPENHAEEFRPLLEALRAGCPPHAGIALGFDRLMAILRQSSSVRDVIAFPKSAKGEDKMVGAPSAIDAERWAEYHMAVKGGEEGVKRETEKDELTTGSKEADQELRSVADPKLQTPGPAQPDESDITPSTPS